MDIFYKIRKKISNANDSLDANSLLGSLKKNALEGSNSILESIDRELKIEKHNLVFIGTIGSGKTTALCYLLGLVDKKKQNIENSTFSPELLVTGSGGSTICEVHILLNNYNYSSIKTEFITKDELRYYVDDFADFIASRVEPENRLVGALLPQEITRALRNILKLKRTEQTDYAIEKYKELGKLNQFKAYLLEKISSVFETEQQLNESDTLFQNHEFIKETFKLINSAALPHYSIPKRITLSLNYELFGSNQIWTRFDRIIDTKGLDGTFGRPDIEKYLKKSKNILAFTSRFADAPDSNIVYQIEKCSEIIKPKSVRKLKDRSAILVLPRGIEPTEKVGAEGDYEFGLTLAKDYISSRIASIKDGIKDENILFFNAKRQEDVEHKTRNIIETINNITIQSDNREVIKLIDNEVDSIIKIKEISKDAENSLINALKKIGLSEFIISDVEFGKLFIEKFNKWYPHWNTKHAINKRKGTWGEYDVFFLARKVFMESIVKDLNSKVDEINNYISNIDTTLSPLINTIDQTFLSLELLKFKLKLEFSFLDRLVLKEFNSNEALWSDLINHEIRGHGYTERVLNRYYTQLSNQLFNFYQKLIADEWSNLINEILDKLGYTFVQSDIKHKLDFELRSFKIQNFQGINNTSEVLIPENSKCIFLTGENGYGKTSILRGIAAGFIGKSEDNYLLVENDDTEIEVTIYDRFQGTEIKRTIDDNGSFKHIVAYGANRNGLGGIKKNSIAYHLFYEDGDFINIEEELMKLEKGNEEQIIYYTNIRRILLDFLEDYIDDIYVHRDGADTKIKYKQKGTQEYIGYNQLATGFKSVIGLVGDIIWRLAKNNYANLKTLSGVVIIDEFDLHLHPKWQKNILIKLNKTFPKVQFIISTHSPIPFLGAPINSAIIEIDRDKNANITAALLENFDFSILQPNAILTSKVFKFDSLIPHAHQGDKYPETEHQHSNIDMNKKIEADISEYLNDDRTKEILKAIKKSDD